MGVEHWDNKDKDSHNKNKWRNQEIEVIRNDEECNL